MLQLRGLYYSAHVVATIIILHSLLSLLLFCACLAGFEQPFIIIIEVVY